MRFSGTAPQRLDQLRAIHFAGSFARGDEDLQGAILPVHAACSRRDEQLTVNRSIISTTLEDAMWNFENASYAELPSAITHYALTVALFSVLLLTATTESVSAQTLTVLHTFTGSDGALPYATLFQDAAGNLYGTASEGGAYGPPGFGVVFKVDTSGNYTVLHSFAGPPNDGEFPTGSLLGDSSGTLYGTTFGGGNDAGAVFKLDNAGNETILHNFGFGTDGAAPYAGLVSDTKGSFYGTTTAGGSASCHCGTVFKVDPAGNESVLYSFAGGADGDTPWSRPILDSKGNLYGTTQYGGTFGDGVVFKLDPTGKETVLYSFQGSPHDGANPMGGLVLDQAGNFYGTTSAGGARNLGTVFKLNKKGRERVLHNFVGRADGDEPISELLLDGSGNLYGTTPDSLRGSGAAFEMTGGPRPLTVLYAFGLTHGQPASPFGGLVMDVVGNLYGTTVSGGSDQCGGCGTVFKITP